MRPLTVATQGTKTVGNVTSMLLLPANSRRCCAIIYNPTTVTVWLGFGVAAVIGTGAGIPPNGGSIVIDEDSGMWRGEVYGIMASGTGLVLGTVDFQ